MKKDLSERPKSVTIAVTLLYIHLGIGIAMSLIGYFTNADYDLYPEFRPYIIAMGLCIWVFILFLIYMISRGHNWARITYLIVFIAGLPFTILFSLKYLHELSVIGVVNLAEIIIEVTGLIYLFKKSSSEWFRQSSYQTHEQLSAPQS
jgi:hypothetical protein